MNAKPKSAAVFEPSEEAGHLAYIEKMSGVKTRGKTLEEAKGNLLEALALIAEAYRGQALVPVKKANEIIPKQPLTEGYLYCPTTKFCFGYFKSALFVPRTAKTFCEFYGIGRTAFKHRLEKSGFDFKRIKGMRIYPPNAARDIYLLLEHS